MVLVVDILQKTHILLKNGTKKKRKEKKERRAGQATAAKPISQAGESFRCMSSSTTNELGSLGDVGASKERQDWCRRILVRRVHSHSQQVGIFLPAHASDVSAIEVEYVHATGNRRTCWGVWVNTGSVAGEVQKTPINNKMSVVANGRLKS